MIFKTQKLEQLKNIQTHNENINHMSTQIIKSIWPDAQSPQSFNQRIQSIAIKWMNQFVILIENWLEECSQKYIKKLVQIQNLQSNNQNNMNNNPQQIKYYLYNLTKYLQTMEYPLLTSINNIHKLYMKFPQDQAIQNPKKSILTSNQNDQSKVNLINASMQNTTLTLQAHNRQTKNKNKKSLSIQSFTSNLSAGKSRSKSKGRKLSLFSSSNNILKQTKSSFLQTNLTTQFKKNSNLNTTVKKVKKQFNFSKPNHFAQNNHRNVNDSVSNNNYQNSSLLQKRESVTDSKILRQRLQQRLSKTCNSTFFNEIVIQRQQQNPNQSLALDKKNKSSFEVIQQIQKQKVCQKRCSMKQKQLELSLKRQILSEIQNKQKENYAYLMKNIENKLNDKLDMFMNKFLEKQNNRQEIRNQQSKKQYKQNTLQQKENQFLMKQSNNNSFKKEFIKQNAIKQNKISQQPIYHEPKHLIKQSRINSFKKEQNQQKFQIQTFQIHKISQIKPIQTTKKALQSRSNSSSILEKDESKIIKPKNHNNSIQDNKSLISKTNNKDNSKLLKNQKNNSPKINTVSQQNSLDSIQIIDSIPENKMKMNSKLKQNKIIQEKTQQTQTIQRKRIQANVTQSIGQKQKQQIVIKQTQKQRDIRKQDDFYTKRIKDLKFNMQNSITSYKQVCDKLTLPVNQTFLSLFCLCYQQFCSANNLHIPSNNQQFKQIINKFSSKTKLPQNIEKFIIDSLIKIDKMVKLKCPPEKKFKIFDYAQKCVRCIQKVFFEKPELVLKQEGQMLKKIKQIKDTLTICKQQQ